MFTQNSLTEYVKNFKHTHRPPADISLRHMSRFFKLKISKMVNSSEQHIFITGLLFYKIDCPLSTNIIPSFMSSWPRNCPLSNDNWPGFANTNSVCICSKKMDPFGCVLPRLVINILLLLLLADVFVYETKPPSSNKEYVIYKLVSVLIYQD